MTNLLEFREWLRNCYSRFSLYILAAIRFITMFVTAVLINQNIGYMTKLKTPITALILSMICAFLPTGVIPLFAAGLIILHLFAASVPLAAIVLGLFVIILLVYYRFSPKYAYALLLTPIALALKVPFLVPLILGVVATPVAMIPVCLGGIVYFFLQNITQASSMLLRVSEEDDVQAYLFIVENTMKSSHMYLTLFAIMLTILIVYVIRRLSIDHAWTISVVCGILFDVIVFLIGDFVFDISVNVAVLLFGAIVSFIIVFIMQFFVFSVDYSRTEYVQFEDDEYYYYVKAVPKLAIAKREKEVKHINTRQRVKDDKKKIINNIK